MIPDRFWRHVRLVPSGCWIWNGPNNGAGYGVINWGGHAKKAYVHRLSYEAFRGPIPEGLSLDHLCRTPACCNPRHLEAVTPRENTMRGAQPAVTRARHAAKTHCPQGHPYDETNTRLYVKMGYTCRACRACEKAHGEISNAERTAVRRSEWAANPPLCMVCGESPRKGVRSLRCTDCHAAHERSQNHARYLRKVGKAP